MAKKSAKFDGKNAVILVLSLVICVETYLLYQSNPKKFAGFFNQKTTAVTPPKTVKKPAAKPVAPTGKSKLSAVADHERAAVQPAASAMAPVIPSSGQVRVAIILDDWGYSTKNCQFLRDIKVPVTVAVLPNLKHTEDVMQCAHQAGKELMLHLPMEPQKNEDQYPEDYILKTTMSPLKIDKLLSDILDQMPLIDGVNNHMGSKATEDRRLMTTIYHQLKYRKLFFIDSRTAPKSVCAGLAKEMGLPFASRDVFLDNVNERNAITTQLNTLARIAKKRGWAIAIGHDRSLTLQVIADRVQWFKDQGIEFVTAKSLISQ